MKSLIYLMLSSIFISCVTQVELVEISTNKGEMLVYLYDETPLHKQNFLKLVDSGFYDNTEFHRVIEGFMIQGGDPHTKNQKKNHLVGQGGPGYTIKSEFNPKLYHKKGALCSARQPDRVNPEKRSNGSQFYIAQGKPLTEKEMLALPSELKKVWGPDFEVTDQMKEDYALGGTAFLDGLYTVFGEVISGIAVIDSIAAVKVNPRNKRPIQPLTMSVKLVKKPKSILKEAGIDYKKDR